LHPVDGQRVCDAVLDVLGTRIMLAVVDAYSDHQGDLTEAALAAQDELRALVTERPRRGLERMGIELDLTDARQQTLLRTYGPWSINAELWGGRYVGDYGCFHDSSQSIVAALTAAEAEALDATLNGLGQFTTIAALRARRRGRSRLRHPFACRDGLTP
jgi:hypothetical protein